MPRRTDYCSVCLSIHDEEIHAATRRIHEWLRVEVNRLFVRIGVDSYADQNDDGTGDTAPSV